MVILRVCTGEKKLLAHEIMISKLVPSHTHAYKKSTTYLKKVKKQHQNLPVYSIKMTTYTTKENFLVGKNTALH